MEKTTGEIYAKMALILTDIRAIGKSQTNQQQRFKFRGIDDLYNHLNPIMGRHGVFNTCHSIDPIIENEIESKQGTKGWHIKSQYTFRFYAGDGSFVESKAIGEAADYGDKGSNKAASIAHKYVLLEAFCIPTENIDDPDAETPEISSVSKTGSQKPAKPQRAPAAKPAPEKPDKSQRIENMLAKLSTFGVTPDKIKAITGVQELDDLTDEQFDGLGKYYVELQKASTSEKTSDLNTAFG